MLIGMENQNPEEQHPLSALTDNSQPQQLLRQRSFGEKVIQPLHPFKSLVDDTPELPSTPAFISDNVNPSFYYPSVSANRGESASESPDIINDPVGTTVAMKHKSLLVLAVVVLLSTLFAIYSAININQTILQIQQTNPNGTGSAHIRLDIFYAGIVFNLIITWFLLLAKNPLTVITFLKILIIVDLVNIFGVSQSNSATRYAGLSIDGVMLFYIYVVYNILKAPPIP